MLPSPVHPLRRQTHSRRQSADVLASWEPEATAGGTAAASIPISLSASPQLKSKLEICYRALPAAPQDARLRPDLRLGMSDAAVRKVASVVRWFEGVAGLELST